MSSSELGGKSSFSSRHHPFPICKSSTPSNAIQQSFISPWLERIVHRLLDSDQRYPLEFLSDPCEGRITPVEHIRRADLVYAPRPWLSIWNMTRHPSQKPRGYW